MRAQPRDDAWATDVEHHVRQRIGSLDRSKFPTTELESVNCRQSICEVRVSHETGAEATAMFELISEVPTVSATFGKREGDPARATLQTVVYLGREGHRLPH